MNLQVLRIFLYFTAVICLFSCKHATKNNETTDEKSGYTVKQKSRKQKKTSEISGTLNIVCEDILFSLMNDFRKSFRTTYSGVQINTGVSGSLYAFQLLDSEEADIILVSTKRDSINPAIYTTVPFARDILVLIVNFNNGFLQTLAMYGISQNTLSEILSEKITDWKSTHIKIKDNKPLKMYIPPKNSGTIDYIADFAGLKKMNIKADDVINETDIVSNVSVVPTSIGLCSHTLAYDHYTAVRRTGIYIVGIDVNNNNFLDNEELIYDDLHELTTSVKKNKAPAKLIREFSIAYRNDTQKRDLIEFFIAHINEKGKTIIEGHNFFPIQQSKTES